MSRVILIFCEVFNQRKNRKETVLNYALNEDTGYSVIMPTESIDYFCQTGAYFDEAISEWVI
jgi:hypothetical protein